MRILLKNKGTLLTRTGHLLELIDDPNGTNVNIDYFCNIGTLV